MTTAMATRLMPAMRRRFVEVYMACGNARQAAREAGYSESFAVKKSHELLRRADVQAAIEARTPRDLELPPDARVLTRIERQAWWTSLVLGEVPGATLEQRLRASELLARSQGDFIDRKHVEIGLTLEQMVAAAGRPAAPPRVTVDAGSTVSSS